MQSKRNRLGHVDLIVVCVFSDIAIAGAMLGASDLLIGDLLIGGSAIRDPLLRPLLRALITFPLVLLLPGYAVTAALFPGRTLGALQRTTLSVGLSLAIAALGGIVLNWTNWGLHTYSWAVLLGALTLAASAVAWLRRRALPVDTAAAEESAPPRLDVRTTLSLCVAGIVVLGAIAVSRVGASQQQDSGFTQLWMTHEAGRPSDIHVGVLSKELVAKAYVLQIKVAGDVLHEWPSIPLQPGESWDATLTVNPSGENVPVEAVLYQAGDPAHIYRRTLLWPDNTSK